MSASTVSVTANPSAATRRRIVGDVKQGIDIINDTMVSPNVDNAGDDKAVGNKDLSHSIRGEAVLERSSKDPKKSQLPNSNGPLRTRNRKAVPLPKPPKPRWRTILSILTKNFLLLLVLVGLVQMVRRLVINSGNGTESASYSQYEGRTAALESSMKTATKMLQVQIEALDKKIDSMVGGLRKDLNRKIEEKGVETDTRLSKLDERFAALEATLDELKSKDLLTRDDMKRLYEELVKLRGGGDLGQVELSWDEVRALAREVVQKEIEKHAADGLGMVDYALASGGASVVKHSEPFRVGKLGNWFSVPNRQGVHGDAEKMLKPSFGEPGQCFALKGSNGYVQIRLRTAIVPEAVTLEHVDESVAYDRSSAPKDCRVSGWLQGPKGLESELAIDGEKMHLLTEFLYDLEKSNAQTFEVLDSARSAVIDTVRFEFSSNHGSATHTCIYRLRVHGHEPSSVPMIGSDS